MGTGRKAWSSRPSTTVPSFDDERAWVFNRERSRAARCRDLGSFDQYGLKDESLIEVWHVATKQLLASFRQDHLVDIEGEDAGGGGFDFAFTEDGRARVIDLMAPVRHDMHLMGGSHAQRDIFYQMLIDAARRAGRDELIPLCFADINRIGFDLVDQRTLYRDAAA